MSVKANRANSLFAGQSKFKYADDYTKQRTHAFDLNIDTSVVDSMLITDPAENLRCRGKD